MRAKALKSFAPASGPPVSEGDEVEVQEGADWVAAGLVEPVEPPKKTAKSKAAKSKAKE